MTRVAGLVCFVSLISPAEQNEQRLEVRGHHEILPQVVDGGGWQTTIRLTNLSPGLVRFRLDFWADGGRPLSLPFVEIGSFSVLTGTIPPGGTATIRTAGEEDTVAQGWAELSMDGVIGGFAVLRQQLPDQPAFQAATPITSRFNTNFAIAFDNTEDLTTAVALVNPSRFAPATVTAIFRSESGREISRDIFTLGPGAHRAFALPAAYPLTAERRGMAEFATFAPQLSALGLEFNAAGGFSFSPALTPF